MIKVTKAVIPVAGFGTRFLPITKAVPKMMLPIIDKPILQYIVEEAADSGITEILFIVGQHSEIIEEYFSDSPEILEKLSHPSKRSLYTEVERISSIAEFSFVVQTEQKGTAHAVALAEEFADGQPFLLMFGDDLMYNPLEPVAKQLISTYEKTGKTVIGCKRVPFEDVPKYASVEYNSYNGRIFNMTAITEKPPLELVKSNLSPLGRYVCTPDIFDYIKKLKVGANNEYQITDAYHMMSKDGKVVAYEFEGTRYDTGDKLGYLKAVVDYALKDEDLGADFLSYLKEKTIESD